MPKFRKKPVVIEAEQFSAVRCSYCASPNASLRPIEGVIHDAKSDRHAIETLEGFMEVSEGDWVITGVKGEKYPCKPEIFEATYESADDPLSDVTEAELTAWKFDRLAGTATALNGARIEYGSRRIEIRQDGHSVSVHASVLRKLMEGR